MGWAPTHKIDSSAALPSIGDALHGNINMHLRWPDSVLQRSAYLMLDALLPYDSFGTNAE